MLIPGRFMPAPDFALAPCLSLNYTPPCRAPDNTRLFTEQYVLAPPMRRSGREACRQLRRQSGCLIARTPACLRGTVQRTILSSKRRIDFPSQPLVQYYVLRSCGPILARLGQAGPARQTAMASRATGRPGQTDGHSQPGSSTGGPDLRTVAAVAAGAAGLSGQSKTGFGVWI